ncbi:MAG: transcription antitermination factor NusB [Casimicrobiaceae bacterium]|nr:transcription antitermination factor NusB [Casimicrobiaceae bacterium]
MRATARRRAREWVIQGLYEFFVARNAPEEILGRLGSPRASPGTLDFMRQLWQGVHREREALERAVASFLDRAWTEVSPVERAIVLLGCYELMHCRETPWRVVLNEAIELAKRYGGTDGHKWVNGVLDRFAAQVRAEEVAQSRSFG